MMKPDQPFKKGIGILRDKHYTSQNGQLEPIKMDVWWNTLYGSPFETGGFHVPGIGFLGGEYQQWILGTWKITKNMESEANR